MLRPSILYSGVLLTICLAPLVGVAAPPFGGPVEAITFDAPTHSFRAVNGTLGSAALGQALLGEIDFGSVAPGRDYAIAMQNGQLLVASGLGTTQVSSGVVAASSLPDGAAWSSDGASAVIYSRKDGWLQQISGLPNSPVLGSLVNVPGSGLSSVVTNGSGQRVFAAIADAGIYEIREGLLLSPVLPLSGPVSLAISDALGVLYALDSKQVYEVNLSDLSVSSWPVTEVRNPVAMAVTENPAHQWMVHIAGDSALVTYDAASHEVIANRALDFQPTTIRTLGSTSMVLRDRQMEGEPIWSFSTAEIGVRCHLCRVERRALRGGEPPDATSTAAAHAVYFIPATPLMAGGAQ